MHTKLIARAPDYTWTRPVQHAGVGGGGNERDKFYNFTSSFQIYCYNEEI